MDFSGEYRIPAPRQKVWEALNDPAILQQAIPGCESLEKTSDTELKAQVRMRVGPVSAKFGGKVTLSDFDPPNSYRISGEGQGGAAGFAKGGAVVKLADDGGGTVLTYTADAQVGGKIAQVGARLIEGTAKKLADEFFGKFAELVGGSAEPQPQSAGAASSPVPASQPAPSPATTPASATRGLNHWLIIGAGAVVLVIAWLAMR
ncbi:MAG: carbon monoxide dehydrogenase subunit G [Alphaproteobacteria bacterium]|nr:carbon monoxide dehydrogenase subunit G [Alphaproteobacteria bacterium]